MLLGKFSFIFFRLFKQHYNFTTNKCEKCPSSIQCWDSNPQSSDRESPPITTRPGLPPSNQYRFAELIRRRQKNINRDLTQFSRRKEFYANGFLPQNTFSPSMWSTIDEIFNATQLLNCHFIAI